MNLGKLDLRRLVVGVQTERRLPIAASVVGCGRGEQAAARLAGASRIGHRVGQDGPDHFWIPPVAARHRRRGDERIEAERDGVAEREVLDTPRSELLRLGGFIFTRFDSSRPACCQADRHEPHHRPIFQRKCHDYLRVRFQVPRCATHPNRVRPAPTWNPNMRAELVPPRGHVIFESNGCRESSSSFQI